YTEGKYYVTGVIVEVYNTQYGNMKIADENGNIITVYGTYSADGKTRYDALTTKPVVGDTVTVYGIIGQYNDTAQVKNGWITAHTAAAPETPETPDEPELPDTPVEPGEGTTVKLVIADYAAANGWANSTRYESAILDEFVTATAKPTQGSYNNTGKYYTSGNNWRIYQNEAPEITISAEGRTIVSVKISYASEKTGILTLDGENIESDTVVSVNAESITFSVGNTGTATNGQVRITAIEVIYN
ncbi:MAG: hypothetical protein J6Q85_02665, partial [Clostridia bacterium]|nr:hypothetical protein [Clostridia bacterium]